MWNATNEELADFRGLRFFVTLASRPATFAEVIRAWQGDERFRSQFNSWLADTPYSAFRWETPSVTADTVSRPFEFILLDSPGLARRPEPEAFAEHFVRAEAGLQCPLPYHKSPSRRLNSRVTMRVCMSEYGPMAQ